MKGYRMKSANSNRGVEIFTNEEVKIINIVKIMMQNIKPFRRFRISLIQV